MQLTTTDLIVTYSDLSPKGWRCGDAVEDLSKNQYYVSDAEEGKAVLTPIAEIDKVKREFIRFTVDHNPLLR